MATLAHMTTTTTTMTTTLAFAMTNTHISKFFFPKQNSLFFLIRILLAAGFSCIFPMMVSNAIRTDYIRTYQYLIFTLHRATIASRRKKKEVRTELGVVQWHCSCEYSGCVWNRAKKKESPILFAYILISFDVVFCLHFAVLYNFSFTPTSKLCIFNILFCSYAFAVPRARCHTQTPIDYKCSFALFFLFFFTIFILFFRSWRGLVIV